MPRSDPPGGGRDGGLQQTDGGETASDSESELPSSVVADLRESERRRLALAHLREREGAIPIADLARVVAAAEAETTVDAVGEEAVDTVRRDLFQEHLPKLTATGVVQYNSLVGTVDLATDDDRLFGDDTDAAEAGSGDGPESADRAPDGE